MAESVSVIPCGTIESRILMIRGQKVTLDAHLAELYGVTTKAFNQAMKRNRQRFPVDFMFQLTAEEAAAVRSQIVTASRRNVRSRPFAFTEHGAIMAATILNSPRAVEASVFVVRAFVKFRDALAAHHLLVKKLAQLEATVGAHDDVIRLTLNALKQLMAPPDKKRKPIGFGIKEKKPIYHPGAKHAPDARGTAPGRGKP